MTGPSQNSEVGDIIGDARQILDSMMGKMARETAKPTTWTGSQRRDIMNILAAIDLVAQALMISTITFEH